MARSTRVVCENCHEPFRTARDRLGETSICPGCGESTILRDPNAPPPEETPAAETAEDQFSTAKSREELEAHVENARAEMFGESQPHAAAPNETGKPQPPALKQKPTDKAVEADMDQAAAEAAAVFENSDDTIGDIDPGAPGEPGEDDGSREYIRKRAKALRARREGNLSQSNYALMGVSDAFENRFGGIRQRLRDNPLLLVGILVVGLILVIGVANLVRIMMF